MSRILFTGLCLIGILGFVFSKPNEHITKKPKTEIVKEKL